ncbi:unnamed protein product, partial [Musa acuminata subsp. burmannicoides]
RHPLHEIAESVTHKLLLKQWIKEEELVARRIALRESRVDAVRREIAALYCAFFVFHSLILLLLYSASVSFPSAACRRSWIPCLCSLLCSMAVVWAVRYKTDTECVLERLLEREREDGVLLGKCVEELKRKGAEFDLLKEVDALRRAKSLRVEAKVRKWSTRDVATMVLLLLSCVVLGLTRFRHVALRRHGCGPPPLLPPPHRRALGAVRHPRHPSDHSRLRWGYVPVLVGAAAAEEEGLQRFLVSVEAFKHACFVSLLEMAAGEFGYQQKGVLRIPCDPEHFRR